MRDELERWSERYRRGDVGSADPASIVVEAVRGLNPGRALDLACGAGRNAIALARLGWDVVAIDGAEEAIRILRERASENGVTIDARVLDLENEQLPLVDESFDLVISILYLQRSLLLDVKRLVRPGGRVIVTTLAEGRFAVEPEELRAIFDGWSPMPAPGERTENPSYVFIHSKTR